MNNPNNSTWPYDSEDAQNIVQAILSVVSGLPQTGDFENGSNDPYDSEDAKNLVEAILQLTNGGGSAAAIVGHYYTIKADTPSPYLLDNDPLIFANDNPSNNPVYFAHVPNSPDILVKISGTYKIEYSVTTLENSGFQVTIDGLAIGGGAYATGAAAGNINGFVVTNIGTGQVVNIRTDLSTGGVGVVLGAPGTADPTVVLNSILITRLF